MFGDYGALGNRRPIELTLYTDAFVVRGTVETHQRRLTDILNVETEDFLILTDATVDEFGTRSLATKTDFAQVNLHAVLFAVSNEPVEPSEDLRTAKVAEQAMISVPPFRIIGRIHLLPNRELSEALSELSGRFVPVTEATYWSDIVAEARTSTDFLAFNRIRAHILAPHREVDPWAGLPRGEGAGATPAAGAATSAGPGSSDAPEPAGGGWKTSREPASET
jgi:hypothetical protein